VRHALNGFAHSIGKVAYTGSGILLAGERANDQAPCALTAWEEDRGIVLGQHAGAVTAIAGLGADCALTAGRDARVVLWDVKARKPIADARVDDWARGLQVSPDGDRAALLGANLRMVRLPELRAIHTLVISPNSIAACAAFAPPENRLLAGLRNGKVLLSPLDQPNGRPVLLTEHAGMLRYAGYLRAQRRYLTAGSERVLRFFDAQSLAQTGELRLGGERLTSLTVSPDERLMAVGDSDACMSLWDLRPLDVPAIAGRPFAAARPADLGALACLDGALHGQTAAVIDYLRAVLQYRFRYDVQIDDASLIRPGEFDIMVE
jgi:hypothetical protein